MTPNASETAFQGATIDLAHVHGFAVAHFRPARTEKGWRTPVGADGKGWPDLTIVGNGRVMFRELKSARRQLEPDQVLWRDRLVNAGADWDVWRPGDWDNICDVLGGGR